MGRPKTNVWLIDNSMLVQLLELTNEQDGAAVTGSVTVTAEIYGPDDSLLHTLTLSHVADGDWEGVVGTDDVTNVSDGDQLRIEYLVDGGTPEAQGEWIAEPVARIREA